MREEKWLEAQYSVLGSVLIDERCAPKVVHETQETDYQGTCLTVYKAIRQLLLAGTPIDPVSVMGVLGAGYQDFLLQLMQITPTAANLDSYIALCKEQARMVQVRELLGRSAQAEDLDTLRQTLEKANALMVEKSHVKITSRTDAMRSFMERHVGPANFLPWPVRELDSCIHAKPGSLIILGGLPSTGKTAWALQCADFWGKTRKVGFFSLETDDETITDRQIAAAAGIDKDQILHNQIPDTGWDRICALAPEFTERHVDIIGAAGFTVADVKAVTMTRGYEVIFVDYLQLLSAGGNNRTEQVTAISIGLHILAQTLKVTVVALSQLSRDNQARTEMSRLRESGQIEQDADVVMILKLEDERKPNGTRILMVAKNKEGPRCDIPLQFCGKTQTFTKGRRSGEVARKYTDLGNKVRQTNRQEARQLTVLPKDSPVPFPEG